MKTEEAEKKKHLEFLTANTYLLVGSGECYNTEIVKGPNILDRMMVMMNGDEWREHSIEESECLKEQLEDPDNWRNNIDLGPTHFEQDVGETDHIELILIEPQALLDAEKEAVKEVCEVLRPFAQMAPLKCRGLQDDEIIFCIAGQHTIRVSDFRKAAALLSKLEGR